MEYRVIEPTFELLPPVDIVESHSSTDNPNIAIQSVSLRHLPQYTIDDNLPPYLIAIFVPTYLPSDDDKRIECLDELQSVLQTWGNTEHTYFLLDYSDWDAYQRYFTDKAYSDERIKRYPLIFQHFTESQLSTDLNGTYNDRKPPKFIAVDSLSAHIADKMFKTIKLISHNRYLSTQYRYYMKTDTDAYINMHRLYKYLKCLDPSKEWYFGKEVFKIIMFRHKVFCIPGAFTVWSAPFQHNTYAPIADKCLTFISDANGLPSLHKAYFADRRGPTSSEDRTHNWCFAEYNISHHISVESSIGFLNNDRVNRLNASIMKKQKNILFRRCAIIYHRVWPSGMHSLHQMTQDDFANEQSNPQLALIRDTDVCMDWKTWKGKKWTRNPTHDTDLLHDQLKQCPKDLESYDNFFAT